MCYVVMLSAPNIRIYAVYVINNEHKCSLSTPTWCILIIFVFPVADMQCASVILGAGKVYVRGKGGWQKRFPGGVSGQSEAGAKQEQGNEGKYQEVS